MKLGVDLHEIRPRRHFRANVLRRENAADTDQRKLRSDALAHLASTVVDCAISGAPESPPASGMTAGRRGVRADHAVAPVSRRRRRSRRAWRRRGRERSSPAAARADDRVAECASRCSGRCSSRSDGVFGEERLSTRASAYGASFAAARGVGSGAASSGTSRFLPTFTKQRHASAASAAAAPRRRRRRRC